MLAQMLNKQMQREEAIEAQLKITFHQTGESYPKDDYLKIAEGRVNDEHLRKITNGQG